MKKIALFPGTFDPIHPGHVDIIRKASTLFDTLYVVVTINPEKVPDLGFLERQTLVKAALNRAHLDFPHVKVLINADVMTAELARKLHAKYLVRSARDDVDFKYELELAAGNNHQNKDLETILIIPSYGNIDYHSRLLKQKVGG